jgi:xanthine dehydrogenase accessory factor
MLVESALSTLHQGGCCPVIVVLGAKAEVVRQHTPKVRRPMRDVLDELLRWWSAGEPAGMATVVATSGSAPRPVGATMLVGPDGSAVGSVSGGRVEAEIYDLTQEVVTTGIPLLRRYGVSDYDALDLGLMCGGSVDIFVERIDQAGFPQLGAVVDATRSAEPVAVVTCVGAPPEPGPGRIRRLGRRLVVWTDRTEGTLGDADLDAAAAGDARGLLASGRSGLVRLGARVRSLGDELTLFVSSHTRGPRMLVFGAIDFAEPLTQVGALLGYRVTVCDARGVFATRRRFPHADEVVVEWPHRYLTAQAEERLLDERTVVCVLTHDPKFDVPLLEVALRLRLGYVGALGARRTHHERLARLRAAGLGEAELARLRSPIGLDLGGRTAVETAVSIAAEIVADRWGGSGVRLSAGTGPIHQVPPRTPGGC